MKNTLIVLSFALAACGGGSMESPDNHGFGWEFDAQGVSGLKLRFKPHILPSAIFAQPAFYEKKWAELKDCAGLEAPPPTFLILVDANTGILGYGPHPDGSLVPIAGMAFADPALLVVHFELAFLDNPDVVKHEMLHYLLRASNGDPDAGHVSPLFSRCAFL